MTLIVGGSGPLVSYACRVNVNPRNCFVVRMRMGVRIKWTTKIDYRSVFWDELTSQGLTKLVSPGQSCARH